VEEVILQNSKMTGTLVCIVSLLYAFKFSRTSNSPSHMRLHFDNSIRPHAVRSLFDQNGLIRRTLRKSHTGFRLVTKMATLNNHEWRNSAYLALFHRIW